MTSFAILRFSIYAIILVIVGPILWRVLALTFRILTYPLVVLFEAFGTIAWFLIVLLAFFALVSGLGIALELAGYAIESNRTASVESRDPVEDLKDQYVAGDIDRLEFENRVYEEYEKEEVDA